jgi:hypothetical protein
MKDMYDITDLYSLYFYKIRKPSTQLRAEYYVDDGDITLVTSEHIFQYFYIDKLSMFLTNGPEKH